MVPEVAPAAKAGRHPSAGDEPKEIVSVYSPKHFKPENLKPTSMSYLTCIFSIVQDVLTFCACKVQLLAFNKCLQFICFIVRPAATNRWSNSHRLPTFFQNLRSCQIAQYCTGA